MGSLKVTSRKKTLEIQFRTWSTYSGTKSKTLSVSSIILPFHRFLKYIEVVKKSIVEFFDTGTHFCKAVTHRLNFLRRLYNGEKGISGTKWDENEKGVHKIAKYPIVFLQTLKKNYIIVLVSHQRINLVNGKIV